MFFVRVLLVAVFFLAGSLSGIDLLTSLYDGAQLSCYKYIFMFIDTFVYLYVAHIIFEYTEYKYLNKCK